MVSFHRPSCKCLKLKILEQYLWWPIQWVKLRAWCGFDPLHDLENNLHQFQSWNDTELCTSVSHPLILFLKIVSFNARTIALHNLSSCWYNSHFIDFICVHHRSCLQRCAYSSDAYQWCFIATANHFHLTEEIP